MKISLRDFRSITGSLIALGITLVLGGAMLYLSGLYRDKMEQRQSLAGRELAEVRMKLERIKQEWDDFHTYYPAYQQLVARGIIGQEQRLDWVESIRHISTRENLFDAKYVLLPRKKYRSPALQTSPQFEVHATAMKVQFSLLHEQQLLDVFSGLSAVSGILLIDQCGMERIAPAGLLRYAPQLRVECILNWVTIRESKNLNR